MAEKDIWAQLDEYEAANKKETPPPEPKKKKKKKSLLKAAVVARKDRGSYLQRAINKALGKK